jgi:hypothetical protein
VTVCDGATVCNGAMECKGMQKSDNHFTIGDRNIFHLAGFTWIRSDGELNIFQLGGSTRIQNQVSRIRFHCKNQLHWSNPRINFVFVLHKYTYLCLCMQFVCVWSQKLRRYLASVARISIQLLHLNELTMILVSVAICLCFVH